MMGGEAATRAHPNAAARARPVVTAKGPSQHSLQGCPSTMSGHAAGTMHLGSVPGVPMQPGLSQHGLQWTVPAWPLLTSYAVDWRAGAVAAASPFQRPAWREVMKGASAMAAGTTQMAVAGTMRPAARGMMSNSPVWSSGEISLSVLQSPRRTFQLIEPENKQTYG